MPLVRVYYDERSGEVQQIEHRADEQYTEENLIDGTEGTSTILVQDPDVAGIPFGLLEVSDGSLTAKPGAKATEPHLEISGPEAATPLVANRPATDADQRRIQEILDMDKSALSDAKWLKLYREYTTLTGPF
jgi:hypothetical protein